MEPNYILYFRGLVLDGFGPQTPIGGCGGIPLPAIVVGGSRGGSSWCSSGRSPYWVNHVYSCLYFITFFCVLFLLLFYCCTILFLKIGIKTRLKELMHEKRNPLVDIKLKLLHDDHMT